MCYNSPIFKIIYLLDIVSNKCFLVCCIERGTTSFSLKKLIELTEIFDCNMDYLTMGTSPFRDFRTPLLYHRNSHRRHREGTRPAPGIPADVRQAAPNRRITDKHLAVGTAGCF